MKRWLLSILLLLAGVLPNIAAASDIGCKMLLCLSNPGGPTEFAECVPPIEELYERIRNGEGMPGCSMAGSASSGGSWAELGFYNTGEFCRSSTGGDADMPFTGAIQVRGISIFIDNGFYTFVQLPSRAGGRSFCGQGAQATWGFPPPEEPNYGGDGP